MKTIRETINHIPKVEIFFRNLDEETREALLELYHIKDSRDMNWDIFPIVVIEEPLEYPQSETK